MTGGFLGSAALDVGIGLAFVYLILALMCTTVNEWIAGLSRRRAKLLQKGIQQLLAGHTRGESSLLDAFYRHPVIRGLMRDGKHPSYLPARAFSTAILDLLSRSPAGEPLQEGAAPAADASEGRLQAAVSALAVGYETAGDGKAKQLEGWFEDAMDRVSGWYKREIQMWTVCVALALTVVVNADTFKIVRHLWADPALRAAIIERVEERGAEPAPQVQVDYKDPNDPLQPTVTRLDPNRVYERDRELLGHLIGWGPEDERRRGAGDWLWRAIGWLLTGIAVSLGAPFWFDVLNKFTNIRSAGKSPDEAAKKPEKRKLPPADRTA